VNEQVLIMTLVTGQLVIGKVITEDAKEKTYSRPGKTYTLEDPLGIAYKTNSDKDLPEDSMFSVVNILALSASNKIKIHEDNVLYFYSPTEKIVDRYNQILLNKVEPLPSDEVVDNEE